MITDFRYHLPEHFGEMGVSLFWPLSETDEFVVLEDFFVTFNLDGEPIRWPIFSGIKTDLASIPRFVPKWISHKVDNHLPAAVVHDDMCVARPVWGSRVTHEIFLKGMIAANVKPWKREAMYRAVLIGGPRW